MQLVLYSSHHFCFSTEIFAKRSIPVLRILCFPISLCIILNFSSWFTGLRGILPFPVPAVSLQATLPLFPLVFGCEGPGWAGRLQSYFIAVKYYRWVSHLLVALVNTYEYSNILGGPQGRADRVVTLLSSVGKFSRASFFNFIYLFTDFYFSYPLSFPYSLYL